MMTNWKKYTKFYFSVVLLASLFLTISVFLVTAEEAVESSHTAAKALIEKKCTVCHSTDRVYGADKNHQEWEQTVKKMIRYSDQMNYLNQQEKETIIVFLVQRKARQAASE